MFVYMAIDVVMVTSLFRYCEGLKYFFSRFQLSLAIKKQIFSYLSLVSNP